MKYTMKFKTILLLILLITLPFIKVFAADSDIETIQFKDVQFYNAMLENLYGYDFDFEHDDSKLQIKMKKSDISSVDSFIQFDYNISDLSGIEKFKNLGVISIDNNNVKDVSMLKDLPLTDLDLCYNPIQEDLSFVENMTTLDTIWLYGTNRTQLPNLSKLKNLQSLYLNENHISDISTIENLPNLIYLNMNENTLEKNIKINTGIREIELPQVLLAAKDPSSKLYTENGHYILTNCTLSEDGKSVLVDTDKVDKALVYIEYDNTDDNIDYNDFEIYTDTTFTINVGDFEEEPSPEPETPSPSPSPKPTKTPTDSTLPKKDNTVSKLILPNAGLTTLLIITIILIALLIINYINYRRFKDIKK